MNTADPKPARSYAAALSALVAGAVAMGASPVFVRLADMGPSDDHKVTGPST